MNLAALGLLAVAAGFACGFICATAVAVRELERLRDSVPASDEQLREERVAQQQQHAVPAAPASRARWDLN